MSTQSTKTNVQKMFHMCVCIQCPVCYKFFEMLNIKSKKKVVHHNVIVTISNKQRFNKRYVVIVQTERAKAEKTGNGEKWITFANLNLNFRTATFSTFDHHYLQMSNSYDKQQQRRRISLYCSFHTVQLIFTKRTFHFSWIILIQPCDSSHMPHVEQ